MGYAPGNYMNTCINCNVKFFGDKYAKQCEPCAINAINESNQLAITELDRIKIGWNKIKMGWENIKVHNKSSTHKEIQDLFQVIDELLK